MKNFIKQIRIFPLGENVVHVESLYLNNVIRLLD